MRIVFESNVIDTKNGTSKKTGKPYTIRTQSGLCYHGKLVQPCRVTLADDQAAYPAGTYEFDNNADALLKLNGYGDFEAVRTLPLRPVQDSKRAAA